MTVKQAAIPAIAMGVILSQLAAYGLVAALGLSFGWHVGLSATLGGLLTHAAQLLLVSRGKVAPPAEAPAQPFTFSSYTESIENRVRRMEADVARLGVDVVEAVARRDSNSSSLT